MARTSTPMALYLASSHAHCNDCEWTEQDDNILGKADRHVAATGHNVEASMVYANAPRTADGPGP